jgi:hypothetical protein
MSLEEGGRGGGSRTTVKTAEPVYQNKGSTFKMVGVVFGLIVGATEDRRVDRIESQQEAEVRNIMRLQVPSGIFAQYSKLKRRSWKPTPERSKPEERRERRGRGESIMDEALHRYGAGCSSGTPTAVWATKMEEMASCIPPAKKVKSWGGDKVGGVSKLYADYGGREGGATRILGVGIGGLVTIGTVLHCRQSARDE